MKAVLTSALLACTVANGFSADANQLKGTWELLTYNNGHRLEGFTAIKIFTDRHFIWSHYDKSGKVLGVAGGTYTVTGNSLVEHVEYTSQEGSALLMKDQPLTISVQADILTDQGTLSSGNKIIEKWKRLD